MASNAGPVEPFSIAQPDGSKSSVVSSHTAHLGLSEAQTTHGFFPVTSIHPFPQRAPFYTAAGDDAPYMSGALTASVNLFSAPELRLRHGGGAEGSATRSTTSESEREGGNQFCHTALRLQADQEVHIYPLMLRGCANSVLGKNKSRPDAKILTCQSCRQQVNAEPARISVSLPSGDRYLILSDRYLAKHHASAVAKPGGGMAAFRCSLCNRSSRTRNEFILHLEDEHGRGMDAERLCADDVSLCDER